MTGEATVLAGDVDGDVLLVAAADETDLDEGGEAWFTRLISTAVSAGADGMPGGVGEGIAARSRAHVIASMLVSSPAQRRRNPPDPAWCSWDMCRSARRFDGTGVVVCECLDLPSKIRVKRNN
ncbi:hypothetical protein ACWPOB_04340 [Rhodococcus sp. 2H158]